MTDPGQSRRQFLARMTALSAAASAGGLAAPLPAVSMPVRGRAGATAVRVDDVRSAALADPAECTVAEAATLMARGELSSVELTEAYLQRIARFEGTYLAFNEVLADAARAEARRRMETTQPSPPPLHGIPLAIKDNFYTAGVRTTANSLIFADFVPAFDATAVARLKAAGAIVLGKTQMGPLATTRATTPTGQVTTVSAWAPHDPAVNPGGSSSGSATAVAARLAAASTGTQTGGSITAPSNAQGLTGIKPTLGRVSLYGVIPLTYTRDHPGPIARDALDAAILLQAMAGADPADPRTLALPPVPDLIAAATPVRDGSSVRLQRPTTVGVPPDYVPAEGAAAAARRALLSRFEELGARLVEVRLPGDWEELTSGTLNQVRLVERAEPFLPHLREDVRLFGVSLSSWINGLLLSGDEYLKGQRARLLLLRRTLEHVFAQCDVVLQPSHLPFDMIGLPLIAFPIGMTAGDAPRPVGAILGGPPFAEDRLVEVVAAYQAATDWHTRRPADPEPERAPGAPPPAESAAAPRGRIRAEDIMELSE